MANIVEQAAKLVRFGKDVILVTSGAVGVGKQRLKKQALLRQSLFDVIQERDVSRSMSNNNGELSRQTDKVSYNSACAAAGQLGLMSLYETMFNQFDITTSQVLLTAFDFTSPERRRNVQYVISQLLSLGIVPLLNENDAVSANQGYKLFGNTFSDNDSLAALVSLELNANLLILLTDVKGVYDRPPNDPHAKLLDTYDYTIDIKIGDKSQQGRGGMGAKVDAALRAIDGGLQAVVIADGSQIGVIEDIVKGSKIGTLFLKQNDDTANDSILDSTTSDVSGKGMEKFESFNGLVLEKINHDPVSLAISAREGSRELQQLSSEERSMILRSIATELLGNEKEILEANDMDMKVANELGISPSNLKRLRLTKEKLLTLADGIRAIAEAEEPIGKILSKTQIAEGLVLQKVTSPIGVLLIIFESRPDSLPQIAALCIRSGNGILLKGGKEAEKSNSILHKIITSCIETVSSGRVSGSVISLLSRSDIPTLLKLDQYVDLVIPRGSSDLVRYIKDNTHITVLGHAEGICHVYVDSKANVDKAIAIVTDSKTDYPAACNAAECLLLHRAIVDSGASDKIIRALRSKGIKFFGGPKAKAMGLTDTDAEDMRKEYGDLGMSIEVVDSIEEAISHIHKYGSGHTESIVTEDPSAAQQFLRAVDSACVFHNASTRFADGYRFGLGAEVGISTGRIHARGPMGVEGLLTVKWIMTSSAEAGHIVAPFTAGHEAYSHKRII